MKMNYLKMLIPHLKVVDLKGGEVEVVGVLEYW
jgi:hypothetical protein